MEKETFRNLVEDAVTTLPSEFQKKMENVAILVEDEPGQDLRKTLHLQKGSLLFGLYQGVPKIRRGSGYSFVVPDTITLFQKSIESVATSFDEVRKQIRQTLLHEVGHHFGMSEGDIRRAVRKEKRT
ncbi:MAG TPA: metallopeptidase family protein [Patescibacteria group bacterium]|nr:metallopeptidase family protein [Patescibacteria group bacterium]